MSRWILLALSLSFAGSAFAKRPEMASAELTSVADYRGDWEHQLRAERELQIQRLQAYAEAGVFPKNPAVNGFSHLFLDSADHPCAVASLIWQAGHEDLVRETALDHNDIVLSEVESGPLVDWMLTSGLTREEVAVIQVPNRSYYPEIVSLPVIDVPAPPDPRIIAEQQRVIQHLVATVAMLLADTDASIATALDRLGDRVHTPPPVSAS